jgi:RNA polymerase sigma-70 factor, ECF subfamily
MLAVMAERPAPRAPTANAAATSSHEEVAARGAPSARAWDGTLIAHPSSTAPSTAPSAHSAAHPSSTAPSTSPHADSTTAALAGQAIAGDRAALAHLLRAHAGDIASVCHHIVGATDARDAAQDSLERIVRELARFDPARGAFRSWALTVARNVCRGRLRRRGLERGSFDREGDDLAASAVGALPDPERLAIAREGASSLARALEGLPEPMRDAVLMFHLGDATYEEIAQTLDVPIGTVMTWLYRGRQRLRAAIEEP